jgi:hypothetical protein
MVVISVLKKTDELPHPKKTKEKKMTQGCLKGWKTILQAGVVRLSLFRGLRHPNPS